MKGWPIHKLIQHPSQMFTKYVRKGIVVVPNHNVCEDLYIVQSGICEVYMRIDGFTVSWRDLEKLMPPDGSTVYDFLRQYTKGLLVSRHLFTTTLSVSNGLVGRL
jgi:hypothetical protein